MDTQHEIMTAEEVAEYLRVGERTVYEWAQKGEIPCGKLGATWRFRRSDIDKWLNEKLRSNTRQVPKRPEPAAVDIGPLLPASQILFHEGSQKSGVLNALVDCLSGLPDVADAEEMRAGVLRRESLMSTGIGLGVGVPHVRLDSIRNLVMGMALCPNGIDDYDAVDGQPVRLVIMIGAHTSQHAQYLRLLAFLSSRLKENTLREKLFAAATPEALRSLLLTGKEQP